MKHEHIVGHFLNKHASLYAFTCKLISLEKTTQFKHRGSLFVCEHTWNGEGFLKRSQSVMSSQEKNLWLVSFSSWIPVCAARCCKISQSQGWLDKAENMFTILLSDTAKLEFSTYLNSIMIISLKITLCMKYKFLLELSKHSIYLSIHGRAEHTISHSTCLQDQTKSIFYGVC